VILNVLVVAAIGFIAYWWINQGALSAVLHCICVIVAGALAFAVWEPLVVTFLLKGGAFDNYAWGMTLGLVFAVLLLVLRVASDKLVPFDIPLQKYASGAISAVAGVVSGVLTVGIILIACGFIQGPIDLLEFTGYARDAKNRGQPAPIGRLWVDAPKLTESFFATVSRGGLSPTGKGSFASSQPEIAQMALSLHKDTFKKGDARTTIPPDAVSGLELVFDPSGGSNGAGGYAVKFTVDTKAFDQGQFILSAAQARLADASSRPKVMYPRQFNQPMEDGSTRTYSFEDPGNYATTPPAQQSGTFVLMFDAPPSGPASGASPKGEINFFLKGLRFNFKQIPIESGGIARLSGSESGQAPPGFDAVKEGGGFVTDAQDLVAVINTLRPASLSTNDVKSLEFKTTDGGNFISGGTSSFPKGASVTISRSLIVKGFLCQPNTTIVMVDVSRGRERGMDIWGDRDTKVKELVDSSPLELVDRLGKGFRPVGYVWERQTDVEICFEPSKPFPTVASLPPQPSSGENSLRLVFIVPIGSEIVGLRVGKISVARCSVKAGEARADY
jgi:hypothetical protein